jgi:hypothetical protein
MLAVAMLVSIEGPASGADQAAIDRAIARGVQFLRQGVALGGGLGVVIPGAPNNDNDGAKALVALTLLECGVSPDDKAIQGAAKALRQAALPCTHTYTLALCILFFDRLGEPGDGPLIESLGVRLLAGQNGSGGWAYHCPGISDAEQRRLAAKLQQAELVARRDAPRERPGEEVPKKKTEELSPEILQQLTVTRQAGVLDGQSGGDNSNTQFATIGLWVARRHGLPVADALTRIDRRFRSTQGADGGWDYASSGTTLVNSTSATMTCAGLLGLAVGHGNVAEVIEEKKLKRNVPDPAKDANLRAGLVYLGTIVGQPAAALPQLMAQRGSPMMGRGQAGKAFYFLWSLERVAVALDLEKIGGKDWYHWGADLLVASQQPDGSWMGDYTQGGADTCFALLFLRRANLTRDLSTRMRGKLSGSHVLKAGTQGGLGKVDARPPSGPGREDPPSRSSPAPGNPSGIEPRPRLPQTTSPAANARTTLPDNLDPKVAALAKELLDAGNADQGPVLDRMKAGKGVMFTEALAAAIPQLGAEPRQKARTVLAERLARMKVESLANYLTDDDTEIRRAAASACAMKDAKPLIPNLIKALNDPQTLVVQAAHAALKDLSGQDFGPPANATRAERARAIVAWEVWLSKQGRN